MSAQFSTHFEKYQTLSRKSKKIIIIPVTKVKKQETQFLNAFLHIYNIIPNLTCTGMHSSRERTVSVEKLNEIISIEHDYCSNQSSPNVNEIAAHQFTNSQIRGNTSTTCANSQYSSHMLTHELNLWIQFRILQNTYSDFFISSYRRE